MMHVSLDGDPEAMYDQVFLHVMDPQNPQMQMKVQQQQQKPSGIPIQVRDSYA